MSDEEAINLARGSLRGSGFRQGGDTASPYDWDIENRKSRKWMLARSELPPEISLDATGNLFEELPPVSHRIVAYDFGLKRNILRSLRRNGFAVKVVPAATPADEVLALKPDGVFLSNGPGDPAALDYAHQAVRGLLGKQPMFGICLGHQVLALALGGKTFKLKFGHRGANQPVKDLRTGKVAITSQNHGYAVGSGLTPR